MVSYPALSHLHKAINSEISCAPFLLLGSLGQISLRSLHDIMADTVLFSYLAHILVQELDSKDRIRLLHEIFKDPQLLKGRLDTWR